MSESTNNNANSAVTTLLVGLLTILFVALKLCGVIDWSWWWVLSPLWITGIVIAAVLSTLLGIIAVATFAEYRRNRARRVRR